MYTAEFIKHRRFLMYLPLLAVPFLTIIFYALGGGKGESTGEKSPGSHGINPKLPDAHFKKTREKDKLGLYEQSSRDSAKHRELIRNDPFYFYSMDTVTETKDGDLQKILQHSAFQYNQREMTIEKKSNRLTSPFNQDPNETRLIRELANLKTVIGTKQGDIPQNDKSYREKKDSLDLMKLRLLAGMGKQSNSVQTDPEFRQIDNLLEKIIDVQHPERLQDSLRNMARRNRPETLPVTVANEADSIDQSWFNGFCDEPGEIATPGDIEAIIEETRDLVSGSQVKMRLLQDIYIAGNHVGKDQLIFGIATLAGERLKITISSIRLHSEILPVSLQVYDMDGLEGIYIPGSLTRDVSKESAGEAISAIGPSVFDPSLGAQAASAGIQAAKALMSKKIKLVRVCVKAGYQIILRDNTRK